MYSLTALAAAHSPAVVHSRVVASEGYSLAAVSAARSPVAALEGYSLAVAYILAAEPAMHSPAVSVAHSGLLVWAARVHLAPVDQNWPAHSAAHIPYILVRCRYSEHHQVSDFPAHCAQIMAFHPTRH